MRRGIVALSVFLLTCSLYSQAQQWSSVLNSGQAINWSNSGVGGIPPRTTNCASLTSSATVSQINTALAACPSGQTVYLAAGTYAISGSITIPSNVTLRGAGANSTVLNATGGGGNVINLGTGSASYNPLNITGGATSGSTSISVSNASAVKAGMYLVIAETNNSSYVSNNGSEGACTWCDGWSTNGNLSRGQIVAVTGVSGSTVTISPGLYGAYTNSPIAVPFNMSASYAGVENLQIYANNTGRSANFGMSACAYCWIKGVESNYTDGDHVDVYWGYRDEVRDSYFSNAFLHEPGEHDSDIDLAYKTSATLVENNIIERTHASIMMEWGAAGNVIAYNYTSGEFDSGSTNFVIGGVSFHGAHPQFNLLEGNVLTEIYPDSVWGTSSQTTAFRNWVVGTNRVCSPLSGRGTVNCTGSNGHYAFQAARAMQMSYLTTKNNFVGNVVGSTQMQSLVTNNGSKLSQATSVEYPATRSYDSVAYGWSFGYGESSDDASSSGCSGGSSPCHRAGTSATDLSHGNFSNADGTTSWASGITQSLPSSFYLSGKPAWWGSLPFPATGPDVSGGSGPGGHSHGNPAETCYLNVMKGSDGGAGGPFPFNASTCYGSGSGGGTSSGPAAPQGLTGVVH
jgi:hypothetical protein